jgi:ADP-ribosylglycohydrolase
MMEATRLSSSITHAHPLGIEGAVLIAVAAHTLLQERDVHRVMAQVMQECVSAELRVRISLAQTWLTQVKGSTPREVAKQLGNGMTTVTSCASAIYIALRYIDKPFEEMMTFIILCGGDVDTIGAMAGSLWGIANGASKLPIVPLERRKDILSIASRLFTQGNQPANSPKRSAGIEIPASL